MNVYRYLAKIYPLIDRWAMPSKAELTDLIQGQKPGRLLDIGCGSASIWPLWFPHECWGIDNSPHMLPNSLFGEANDRLILADAQKLPFDEPQFEIAVLSHVLSTLKDPHLAMMEVHRVLKPNGICYIQNHDSSGWNYFDRLIHPVARCLGVKVPFEIFTYIDETLWLVENQRKIGRFSYFKLITLRKR